jgi:hypothetical protein
MKARVLLILPLLLAGCVLAPPMDPIVAKRKYLAAKNECVERYRSSLTQQSDCRTRAADIYIRPTYRYGDLMTQAQEQRREAAERADRHEITRREYNREIAASEAAVAREEDRRNAMRSASHGGSPFKPLIGAITGLFH